MGRIWRPGQKVFQGLRRFWEASKVKPENSALGLARWRSLEAGGSVERGGGAPGVGSEGG